MLVEPTSICRALVGLADIDVVGVIGWTVPMQVHIASTAPRPDCSCGRGATIKQTLRRRLVDLPCFGRPTVTVWRQRRWRCPDVGCRVGSWTEVDERIVIGNRGMTDRAARWACEFDLIDAHVSEHDELVVDVELARDDQPCPRCGVIETHQLHDYRHHFAVARSVVSQALAVAVRDVHQV